ncbi:vWA domain-containing protein [Fictibacillus sp. NRS-1165]|uniref:vWA domain-containing protein n=1 Tax=Fictibacillus sp. NRS-1165 TaxID=3144463 RepID=UPI003D1EDA24
MKFLTFADTKIDPFLHMQLIDLAKTLSKDPKMDVEFSFHSYLNKPGHVLHVSQFWMTYPGSVQLDGLKSEVYLRSFGNFFFSDHDELQEAMQSLKIEEHFQFLKHLLLFSEDYRLEKVCISKRPGMSAAFSERKRILLTHFQRQYRQHIQQRRWMDAFFCSIFLLANHRLVQLQTPLKEWYGELRPFLVNLNTAESTAHIIAEIHDIKIALRAFKEGDMTSSYLSFYESDPLHFKDITRENEAKTPHSMTESEDESSEETAREEMPSWHNETSSPSDSFLQFDLDQGTSTDLLGEGGRKAEEGDQAFGAVQAGAKDSKGNDFKGETGAGVDDASPRSGQGLYPYGQMNRFAVEKKVFPKNSSFQDMQDYQQIKSAVQSSVSLLKQSFLKTIEHKKNVPNHDLHFGRLNKKLTRLLTDKNPRLFFKKAESPQELDAVFTLLVDCSASMFDKMEETHKAIVLFHETLKAVRIPHSITGFWEDASDAKKDSQPNYFQEVISFTSSLKNQSGAEILQLEPQEDNRDGYSIRKAAEDLLRRKEKQKFLLVFSDGEPAAFDYEGHGILDTYEAVVNTRKMGIDTLGMYISNGKVTEEAQILMKNIYGSHQVVVPSAAELVSYLVPVLRKLLFKIA